MDIKIFSGTSNVPLAQSICKALGLPVSDIYHHFFPSKECYAQYKENIRGNDVFLIQTSCNPVNDYFMQLLIMIDAAKRASAARITVVVPMFFYQRQDRKDRSRVPISAKLIMNVLATAGVDRILTIDLHSPQIAGFTDLPLDHLYFEPVLSEYVKSSYDRNDMIVVAPDTGAIKRAERYAELLKCDMGFISKKRKGDEKVELLNFIGDVNEKTVLFVDDMTESVGTLAQAVNEAKLRGARKIIAAVTHPAITDTGKDRLAKLYATAVLDEFITSNSVDVSFENKMQWMNSNAKFTVLDTGPLFAKAIKNIHENKSVSELF